MFLGTHTPRLDDKGRLALPARFRPELEGGLVICKGQDRCLYVFPTAEFSRFTAGAARRAGHRPPGARLRPGAVRQRVATRTPDGQGRITVPVPLRDYAGLAKDCVVIGANSRIEIWNAAAWQDYLDGTEQAFADVAEEVLPGVL